MAAQSPELGGVESMPKRRRLRLFHTFTLVIALFATPAPWRLLPDCTKSGRVCVADDLNRAGRDLLVTNDLAAGPSAGNPVKYPPAGRYILRHLQAVQFQVGNGPAFCTRSAVPGMVDGFAAAALSSFGRPFVQDRIGHVADTRVGPVELACYVRPRQSLVEQPDNVPLKLLRLW
jgi:hypothetical protein